MSPELAVAVRKVEERGWKTFGQEDDGTLRQWAELDFVPGEKSGTVEHVHDEVKNWLGGGHMPSRHFAVNAAWFKLALLTYNLVSATRGLCFSAEERTVRMKKFRLTQSL